MKKDVGQDRPQYRAGRRGTSRREFLKKTAAAGVGVSVAPMLLGGRRAFAAPSEPYIQGYTDQTSYAAGDKLVFRVSTREPEFRIVVVRYGARMEPVWTSDWIPGKYADPGSADTDFRWPAYSPGALPDTWRTGVYLAMFETRDAGGIISGPDETSPYAIYGQALFVVRPASVTGARILYKIPSLSYQAFTVGRLYDDAGKLVGGNFDEYPKDLNVFGLYVGSKLTLRRPGGGTGGDYQDGNYAWGGDLVDPYQGGSRRDTFAHWDAPMIAWLESNGYAVDYCSDVDLHRDTGALLDPKRYKVLAAAGHDPYWSFEMRDHVFDYVMRGGNVAFFTGNTAEWRVHFTDSNTAIYCNKDAIWRGGTDRWWDGQGWPENDSTGVGVRNGGSATKEHALTGFTVQRANHWVYGGTGLVNGDVFGASSQLVSYDAGGARFVRDAAGNAVLDLNADDLTYDWSSENFRILGVAELSPRAGWSFGAREEVDDAPFGATLGLQQNVGTVFTAATSDWARVLSAGDKSVDRITRNVLDGLSASLKVRALGHLNLDGLLDMVLQHPVTKQVSYWILDGTVPTGGADFDISEFDGGDWQIAGIGPLNPDTDGANDLLWRDVRTGDLRFWLMDANYHPVEKGRIDNKMDALWNLVSVTDMNADGVADLVWQHAQTGEVLWSTLNKLVITDELRLDMTGIDKGTRVAAVADLDGDGSPDIVWQSTTDGTLSYSLLRDGKRVSDGRFAQVPDKGWNVVGAGDLDSDGGTDLMLQDSATGQLQVWYMQKMEIVKTETLDLQP
jgi:hypothetical protein